MALKKEKFVRDPNSSLKLLTFQLSNVGELENIKYAFSLTVVCLMKTFVVIWRLLLIRCDIFRW